VDMRIVRLVLVVVLVVVLSTGCSSKEREAVENLDPTVNQVDPAILAPRLLKDDDELRTYIDAFPLHEYKVHEVPGQGKFYLDAETDTIKDFLRRGIRWERHIDALVTKHLRTGTVGIDAGAHIGTHTLTMARAAGANGRVYAFEPQRKIFRELVHNLRLNGVTNVTALRYALGAGAEIIEMSAAAQGNEGGTGVGQGGDRAELRTLDSFGFKNVSFIKIDVEGFEDFVLDGARATIAANKPVLVVEIIGGQDYETATPEIRARIDRTKEKLASLGYVVTKVSKHDYLALPK
jgi:FkbM family methyltransferase